MSAENEFETEQLQYQVQNAPYTEETPVFIEPNRSQSVQFRSPSQFFQPSTSANYSVRKGTTFEACEIKSTVLKPSQSYYQLARNSTSKSTSILGGPLNPQPKKSKKGSGKRKNCNCTKSQCLKLYCDCFANGEFCLDCNCKDCHNNLEHESERSKAIKSSLDRNPHAFKPKIGVAAKVGKAADLERLHQKGCNCKKSNCLKNYCECYEAKVPCTERCKCNSCKNTEHDRALRFREKFSAAGLAQLAAAAANDNRGDSPSDDDSDGDNDANDPKGQPWFYMTDDVIEATTMCLVSYAQEMENTITQKSEEDIKEEMERGILIEFSRCIGQIVESAKGGHKTVNL
ncbi:unnamed protein product [Bursaphelenchus xylophilus]|uniref:(pine wood nematode) hypothetical protein n=1 Tax=Bursaphelenchus xylophilus TaxID=6326 RepID=A0A1I7RNC7_BURXY|nr:unnamed protein product [Bursaphelenchus xylophilus]CAG9123881.1 unnamed protein product [Bursaphelenchus xylophilus]